MKEGAKVTVKQIRSQIGSTERVRATLSSLGLGRIGRSKEFTLNPALIGMISKVRHLVSVRPAS